MLRPSRVWKPEREVDVSGKRARHARTASHSQPGDKERKKKNTGKKGVPPTPLLPYHRPSGTATFPSNTWPQTASQAASSDRRTPSFPPLCQGGGCRARFFDVANVRKGDKEGERGGTRATSQPGVQRRQHKESRQQRKPGDSITHRVTDRR